MALSTEITLKLTILETFQLIHAAKICEDIFASPRKEEFIALENRLLAQLIDQSSPKDIRDYSEKCKLEHEEFLKSVDFPDVIGAEN